MMCGILHVEFGFVTKCSSVAEKACAQSEADADVETSVYGIKLYCYQSEYGAHNGCTERLTDQTRGALHTTGTTATVDWCGHYHDNVVWCLEHAEPDTADGHTPSDIPHRSLSATNKQKNYAQHEYSHSQSRSCSRVVMFDIACSDR